MCAHTCEVVWLYECYVIYSNTAVIAPRIKTCIIYTIYIGMIFCQRLHEIRKCEMVLLCDYNNYIPCWEESRLI